MAKQKRREELDISNQLRNTDPTAAHICSHVAFKGHQCTSCSDVTVLTRLKERLVRGGRVENMQSTIPNEEVCLKIRSRFHSRTSSNFLSFINRKIKSRYFNQIGSIVKKINQESSTVPRALFPL